jgi:hypothetical protein
MRLVNTFPILAIILTGCAAPPPPRGRFVDPAVEEKMGAEAPNAESTAKPILRELDRLDIIEAVFRYQYARAIWDDPSNYFFVALDGGIDPPPALLKSLESNNPLLLPASMASFDPQHNVIHKYTGGHGQIFIIRGIAFIDEATADVNGDEYESPLGGAGETFRLVSKDGKWTVAKWRLNYVS